MQHVTTLVARGSRASTWLAGCSAALRVFVALTVLAPVASVTAQSLAERVAAAGTDASVYFGYESHPDVCGNGEDIMIRDSRDAGGSVIQQRRDGFSINRGRSSRERMLEECRHGPVRVELTRVQNRITAARITVAATERAEGRDLGTVSAADAVSYLLADGVSRSDARPADKLVFAATIANAESWPALLRVARNRELAQNPRNSAIFWLAQKAGEKATQGLTSLIGDDSEELEVRKTAVFALSQIKTDETLDQLMRIARTNPEPEIRKNAMFWLGQSRDPRVLAFFEEILKGG